MNQLSTSIIHLINMLNTKNLTTSVKTTDNSHELYCDKLTIAKILQGFCQSALNESNEQDTKSKQIRRTLGRTNFDTDNIQCASQKRSKLNNDFDASDKKITNKKTNLEVQSTLTCQKNVTSAGCCGPQISSAISSPLRRVNNEEQAVKEALPCFRHIIHMPYCSIQTISPFHTQRLNSQMHNSNECNAEFKPITVLQIKTPNITKNSKQEPIICQMYKPIICRMIDCKDYATRRSPYCTQHSGVRRCEYSSCNKYAQGQTKFCISHGGGRRCSLPGCTKAARDRKFCAAHGGGRRCDEIGCTKVAVGGYKKCTGHGGGRRCQAQGCDKAAQSSSKCCVRHGGGRKCVIEGCSKVARGKTSTCMAHRKLVTDLINMK